MADCILDERCGVLVREDVFKEAYRLFPTDDDEREKFLTSSNSENDDLAKKIYWDILMR